MSDDGGRSKAGQGTGMPFAKWIVTRGRPAPSIAGPGLACVRDEIPSNPCFFVAISVRALYLGRIRAGVADGRGTIVPKTIASEFRVQSGEERGAPAMLLAYDDYGPGPVVVLLHGFPLNRKIWYGAGDERRLDLSRDRADLRGHGDSAAPEGVYTMDVMADDVIELLDALQITEPVVLGGLSMGGYVALSLMARIPSGSAALMLMDTRADRRHARGGGREELARQVEAAGAPGRSSTRCSRSSSPRRPGRTTPH